VAVQLHQPMVTATPAAAPSAAALTATALAHGLKITCAFMQTVFLHVILDIVQMLLLLLTMLGRQSLRGCVAREGVGARPKDYTNAFFFVRNIYRCCCCCK
jgi:hypothetical protein